MAVPLEKGTGTVWWDMIVLIVVFLHVCGPCRGTWGVVGPLSLKPCCLVHDRPGAVGHYASAAEPLTSWVGVMSLSGRWLPPWCSWP